MLNKYFILGLLCLSNFVGIAQNNDTSNVIIRKPKKTISKYRSTQFSVPYKKYRDEGHSPLTYQGLTYQITGYHERFRKLGNSKLEFIFNLGFIKTDKKKVNTVTKAPIARLEINYHYLFFATKVLNQKGNVYIGGTIINRLDGRLYTALINNSFGYLFSNALHPSMEINYPIPLGSYHRNCQIGVKGNFALLTHFIRPNFIGMEPVQAYEGEKISVEALFFYNNKIRLPNQYLEVNTEIYFDRFQLSNSNKVRIFYQWGFSYIKTETSNPLFIASHSLGITSMIYSNKPKSSLFKRKI